MKPYREIEFTTTRSHNGLTAGKTCYQGHLQHNAVLSEKDTRKQFAEYCCEDRSRTDRYLNALGEFISRKIAHGQRLNFGPFAVELKLLGGFQGANAPFDEKKNAISVCLIPSKELKAAVKALKPVNVTEDTHWYLSGALQHVPYEVWDQLVAEGPRQFTVTGLIPPVHPSQSDEGVWLEDDTGEKVAVATIVSSGLSHTDCTLEGSLARNDYWMVIQGRYLNEPNLIRCRHRVKVVGVPDTTTPNATNR